MESEGERERKRKSNYCNDIFPIRKSFCTVIILECYVHTATLLLLKSHWVLHIKCFNCIFVIPQGGFQVPWNLIF